MNFPILDDAHNDEFDDVVNDIFNSSDEPCMYIFSTLMWFVVVANLLFRYFGRVPPLSNGFGTDGWGNRLAHVYRWLKS